MRMSAAELLRQHAPLIGSDGPTAQVTFADPAGAAAFVNALAQEAREIPRDATRMIRSIDLKQGSEFGRAVLELVDGDLRTHRFFVDATDLHALATIRMDARRDGGFITTISGPGPEIAPDDRGLASHAPADGADAANLDAERKDDLLELAHIHTRLDRADDRIRRQQRQINTIMATYVERAHLPNGRFPSYCCQRCGDQIGWIGRVFQAVGLRLHTCRIRCGDETDLATAEAVRSKVEAA